MKYALLLFLPLLAACGEKAPPAEKIDTGPKLVKALKVGAGRTAAEEHYSGEVRARVESTLGFRITGKITERLVDVGARVKPGQALARLDPADQQLAAAQAEANRKLAEAELKRTQDLREKNFISAAALDAKTTVAEVAASQARLARNQAAYTTLVADAAGTVAAVLAEPGQVVGAGQAVFRLARDGQREVAIAIPESRLSGLKVGQAATVALWSGKPYRGVLRELAPMADAATRTFAARVAIVDADEAVALGMTATVRFARDTASAIIVPLAALLQQGDKTAVWIIGEGGVVRQQPIEIARYSDAGAVVAAGLSGDETIVAAGAFKLADGEKVRTVTP